MNDMLYPHSREPFSPALFRCPGSEYRGTPFWAWNCRLDPAELMRQIEIFRQMGFGGFHMHVRTGMETPYLSDEHMDMVRRCVDKAREQKMLAWLYDEDRWPSGAAGGLVTAEEKYRQQYLVFSAASYEQRGGNPSAGNTTARAARRGGGELLARYDVELTADGCLAGYKRLAEGERAVHRTYYAYAETPAPNPWFNNATYVNTLDKRAMKRFVELTYTRYRETVGAEFGSVVPAMFTDEPQFTWKTTLGDPFSDGDVFLPWSGELPNTYAAAGGGNLLGSLPELIWELPDGAVSPVRYRYHDHVTERFVQAFADTCGDWCRENGLKLTGHMLGEQSLQSQTMATGEAMRSYRSFGLPGIDMLCGRFELTTAKQAQSAARQYGREGVASELYGVTGWDCDFRDYKLQGDWQAALGVTVRVPHLAWVSMEGEAKRDCPASIHYQSPWHTEFGYVEDHFARVNTALTRGRPVVRIGVIHPIESFWLHWGPAAHTAPARQQLETNFTDVINWLSYGSLDFDFIAESLLPDLCPAGGAPLKVGQMAYDAVVVPGCETLRSSTYERLEAFCAAGGRLIVMGDAPRWENALPSGRGEALAASAQHIPFMRKALLEALEPVREAAIRYDSGNLADQFVHQLRQDGEERWLFIAAAGITPNKDAPRRPHIRAQVKGLYRAERYDTLTGDTSPLPCTQRNGFTEIPVFMYEYESLLVRLIPCEHPSALPASEPAAAVRRIPLASRVPFVLNEPNVLLLDMAEYALDDQPYAPAEELLRADNACRRQLGWPVRQEAVVQPWTLAPETPEHTVRLRFAIQSETAVAAPKLAMEHPETAVIRFNGRTVSASPDGYYVDKAIRTVTLPPVEPGTNVLELVLPFGRRTNVEWCYLLGDFGVRACGREAVLTAPPRTLAFDSIVHQGLPFYGGQVRYQLAFCSNGGALRLRVPHFKGAVVKVSLDGTDDGLIAYPPYTLELGCPPAGAHELTVTLYVPRTNAFNAVHFYDDNIKGRSANSWRSTGDRWRYEYDLYPEGIFSPPELTEYESKQEEADDK